MCRAHLLLEPHLFHPILLALLRELDELLTGLGAGAGRLVALLPQARQLGRVRGVQAALRVVQRHRLRVALHPLDPQLVLQLG